MVHILMDDNEKVNQKPIIEYIGDDTTGMIDLSRNEVIIPDYWLSCKCKHSNIGNMIMWNGRMVLITQDVISVSLFGNTIATAIHPIKEFYLELSDALDWVKLLVPIACTKSIGRIPLNQN
jgi:hypothetical protein